MIINPHTTWRYSISKLPVCMQSRLFIRAGAKSTFALGSRYTLPDIKSVMQRLKIEKITFCELGVAESEGFEPPDLLQPTVFKTAAFDRSANSPLRLQESEESRMLLYLSYMFIEKCSNRIPLKMKSSGRITDCHDSRSSSAFF